MKRTVGFAATAAAGLALTLTPALAQTPKPGGILNFAIVAEPPTFDCHATTTFATIHPVRPHYSGLLRLSGDVNKSLKIVGDLAKSWEMSKDGLTYTFKLHEGVKFHDGSDFSSADVKASYERIVNPPEGVVSARKALHADITAIETPDKSTVIVKLKAPNASMLNNFASPFNCIYSAAKLKQNPKYPATEIMGTGAFQFVNYTKGSVWEAKKFANYFQKGKPYLDGYKGFFVKSNAVVPGLQGGQFDAEFRGRSPKELDQLKAAMGDKLVVQEGPWTTSLILVFNTKKKPFDDVRVRQALTMSIDRWGGSKALSKISMLKFVGGFTRTGSEWSMSADELAKLPGYSRDMNKAREEAKKLLAAAGVKDLKVAFLNRNIAEPYTPAGIYVVDQWRRIGVTAEHKQLETKLYFDAFKNGEFDVGVEFIADFIDDPSIHFVKTVPGTAANYTGFKDAKLTELFQKQSRIVDPAERKKLTQEYERHAISQAHVAMLFWWQRIVAYNKKIKGWELHASHFTGQELVDVWLDQ